MNNPKSNIRPFRFLSPLHRAGRQSAIYLEERLGDLEITGPECHLMSFVHVYGPCRIGELVRVFGYKKPTMTSMLDRLEARKLVRRTLSTEDRRSFEVTTTARGGRLADEARRRVERFDDEVVGSVSPRDLEGFRNVIRAVERITGVDVRGRETTTARGTRAERSR